MKIENQPIEAEKARILAKIQQISQLQTEIHSTMNKGFDQLTQTIGSEGQYPADKSTK